MKSDFLQRNKVFSIIGFLTIIILLFGVVFKLFIFSSSPKDSDAKYYKEMHDNYIIYSPKIPQHLEFAGEKVPLERNDVRRALDYELLKVMYWHSETILYIKRKEWVFRIVEPILKKYGVPDDFKYLLVTESGMVNVVSPSQASGYWQIMKPTALDYGLVVNDEVDERFDLEKSTEAACKYLLDSYKIFGNWTLAAASYNVGRDHMKAKIQKQKQHLFYDLLLNRQTSRYLYRILAFKLVLSNPRDYGFYIRKKDCYKEPKVRVIKVDKDIPDLVEFALHYKTTYRMVKILNPWLRSDKLTNLDKVYYIKIPRQ
jgi:hypothetical protein